MAIGKKSYNIIFSTFKNKLFWSVFILMLVHAAGAIGMAFFDTRLFSAMTPYNLMLMFILLIWNEEQKNKRFLSAFLIAFYVGLFAELIGVNTQILFGNYSYGTVLGLKFISVPILIGVNWFIIVFSTYQLAGYLLKKFSFKWHNLKSNSNAFITQALLAALFAVLFDWLMEPVALKLGFWFWKDDIIPFFNYTCWFIFSFLISLSFNLLAIKGINRFATFLIVVQTIFFIFLRIFLN
jgi:putative membrane protein